MSLNLIHHFVRFRLGRALRGLASEVQYSNLMNTRTTRTESTKTPQAISGLRSYLTRRSMFVATLGAIVALTACADTDAPNEEDVLSEDNAAATASMKSAVVIIHLAGGYNALFSSAKSFLSAGSFGVTQIANFSDLGNNLFVDRGSLGSLPPFALTHMATLGVDKIPISSHAEAQANIWYDADAQLSRGVVLANAIGGTSTAKAVRIGSFGPTMGPLEGQGYTDVTTITGPLTNEIVTAYGLSGPSISNFASKMAGAEARIRSGANVIALSDGGWDTHGDRDGAGARTKMSYLIPALSTFIQRVVDPVSSPNRNVTVVILGDFARSLPNSDHASILAPTVIGRSVKVGTTGFVGVDVNLLPGTPRMKGLWAYLAAVAKVPSTPFGPNPHPLVLSSGTDAGVDSGSDAAGDASSDAKLDAAGDAKVDGGTDAKLDGPG